MKDILKPLQLPANSILPFVQISENDVENLIPILKKRMPYSVFMHNAAVAYPRFKDCMTFYTLHGEIDESSWIVSVVVAEDFGLIYTVSASQTLSKISVSEAAKIFETCPLFQWEESHLFTCSEKWISAIIYQVSVNAKGNMLEVHPANFFWYDSLTQEQEKIETGVKGDLDVRRLDSSSGVEFILSTWKFVKEGATHVVKRAIERNESAAVYINGTPVCGLIFQCFGMISALYTLEEFRGKGYAKIAMKFAIKELCKNGFIPASGVDARNIGSKVFHEKLGFKMSEKSVDFIICTKPDFN